MSEIITTDGNKSTNSGIVFGDNQSQKYAQLSRLITRDLNNNLHRVPALSLYTKDKITRFLNDPAANEEEMRKAVRYIYNASSHFRRLIQYFVGLSDLAYVVAPYRIDPKKASSRIVSINYRKVLNMLSSMNIKTQLPKILTVCFREDVYYGTLWVTSDSITIQQLPSAYCAISEIEGNVANVSFDFSYFDTRKEFLEFYPKEFSVKYEEYKASQKKGAKRKLSKWQVLSSPNSFAIKCNADILDYAVPPFAGILREIYDIEDYKQLKLTKTEIENYALVSMTLPMTDDGMWGIDLQKAEEFWRNLDNVLPEEIGSVLTPMPLNKISFEKSNTGDTDTIASAEQNMFSAAGVSSLLFNNEKASANALLLSIKVDQAMTYGVVKSIGDAINRFLQAQPYGKYFVVNFLDCSPFNRKELGDAYLKAASYGLPTISMYAATQGLGQAELDSMSYLENDILGLHEMFKPLRNSAQMGSSDEEAGAPEKDIGELTDSGEQNREDGDDW